MHYAELPIPTTEAQGAFSLNIRSVGVCTFDRTLLAFCVSFGRIGSLPSYPVQIKSKELNDLLTSPLKESAHSDLASTEDFWIQLSNSDLCQ